MGQGWWDIVQRRLKCGEPVDQKGRATPGAYGVQVSRATVNAVARAVSSLKG